MQTSVRPTTIGPNPAVPWPSTASVAAALTSMTITVSARTNTSDGLAATRAPAARSGAQRSADRFHTTSGMPATARFSVIGWPTMPRPTKPISSSVARPACFVMRGPPSLSSRTGLRFAAMQRG